MYSSEKRLKEWSSGIDRSAHTYTYSGTHRNVLLFSQGDAVVGTSAHDGGGAPLLPNTVLATQHMQDNVGRWPHEYPVGRRI